MNQTRPHHTANVVPLPVWYKSSNEIKGWNGLGHPRKHVIQGGTSASKAQDGIFTLGQSLLRRNGFEDPIIASKLSLVSQSIPASQCEMGKERDKEENLPLNTHISNPIPLLGQNLLL